MAISSSNSGGAWDNAKKYIEGKNLEILPNEQEPIEAHIMAKKTPGGKNTYRVYNSASEAKKASVVGDTVGDPLKDTSGPSLNILVKLSAIVSLVFGSFFAENSLFKF